MSIKAIVCEEYGPPEVLEIEERPAPQLAPGSLLVEVHATSVTTADWRMRAADFGRGLQLIGRLVSGLWRPRNRLTGREFSGRVIAVAEGVSNFQVGDAVFGVNPAGVNAETIVVPADGPIERRPSGFDHAEAVSLPFGANTAVVFLEDLAKLKPGERVLIVGASGGVGVYAVQIAKHLGAEVVAVCSGRNADLVRSLGADAVIDYTREDPREAAGEFDVILDCVGKTTSLSIA